MRRPRSSLVDGPAGPGRGITWVVVFPAVTESGREHRHSLIEVRAVRRRPLASGLMWQAACPSTLPLFQDRRSSR